LKVLKCVLPDDDDDDDDNTNDTSNNRSNWNHFKILQKILEKRTGKARYQGTTENSHIGHSTHTAESANVEAQNIQHAKWQYMCHEL
jgi:hypothetical protein